MSPGIRAGSLHANESLLVVDPKGSRAMSVSDENREFVVRVKPANRTWLFLREVDAAIRRADQPVGIVRALPHELPFEAARDDTGDFGGDYVLGRGRLSEFLSSSASGIVLLLLLCDGNPAHGDSRSNKQAGNRAH